MAVQVQGPRQRKDLLDVILGGLQAASAYTNIQKGQAELENIPEVKARLKRQEKQSFAANFTEVDADEPGAIELETPGGRKGIFVPRAEVAEAKKQAAELIKEQADAEAKLRDKWLNNVQTKMTQDVSVAAGKVRTIGTDPNPSAAGDLSMIFNYMKLLDPGSVVREGEFATAQNATGIPQRVQNLYNNMLRGERLNVQQRSDFVSRAEQLYEVHLDRQRSFNAAFEDLAVRNKLNPKNIILDLGFEVSKGGLKAPSQRNLEDIQQLNQNLQRIRTPNQEPPKEIKIEGFDIDEFLAE